MLTSSNTDL